MKNNHNEKLWRNFFPLSSSPLAYVWRLRPHAMHDIIIVPSTAERNENENKPKKLYRITQVSAVRKKLIFFISFFLPSFGFSFSLNLSTRRLGCSLVGLCKTSNSWVCTSFCIHVINPYELDMWKTWNAKSRPVHCLSRTFKSSWYVCFVKIYASCRGHNRCRRSFPSWFEFYQSRSANMQVVKFASKQLSHQHMSRRTLHFQRNFNSFISNNNAQKKKLWKYTAPHSFAISRTWNVSIAHVHKCKKNINEASDFGDARWSDYVVKIKYAYSVGIKKNWVCCGLTTRFRARLHAHTIFSFHLSTRHTCPRGVHDDGH